VNERHQDEGAVVPLMVGVVVGLSDDIVDGRDDGLKP